ncbi:hypothetical protein JUJ52_08655 [Virgibacillus sp. AGTR]|uniref:hypothetical protein n=1 Tax=unclassified Virgibacillus TaxID=2620237 RepID=UPI001965CD0A|nr:MULTISPECIES: hypothetical protein [unclassified Virgibacillus]MCC2250035.1 hypothetical protein [Virgibacillus sp. AGTR]MDY7044398.1 hypothetical protein [Virgibacillus sp. M23]QRZ17788.1 hypothetical protein JUJ52_18930 [Virgibacillus sp. AGTR]
MRAIISFEGKQCPVKGIRWNEDGSIAHLSFYDKNGEFRTIFKEDYDLKNMVTWEEVE